MNLGPAARGGAGRTALLVLCVILVAVRPLAPAEIRVEGGCTLVDAMTAANDDVATGGCTAGAGDDDIVLTRDVLLTTSVDGENGLPIVTSTIAIRGDGFEISRDTGAPDFRLIEVDGGDLTLENLALLNGSLPSGSGGAIYSDFSTLTLNGVTVSYNYASLGGGIFADYGAVVTISDSIVSQNQAEWGGGIRSDGADLLLHNTTVDGNSATASGGGVLASSGVYRGTAHFEASTISGNTASSGGGLQLSGGSYAFYLDFLLSNSTVSGNSATDAAGGVEVSGMYGNISLLNTTIANNSTMYGPVGGLDIGISYTGFSETIFENNIVAYNVGGNCDPGSAVVDLGGNLDDDDTCGAGWGLMTGLDPVLRFNGGPTQTHALLGASSAIDAGGDCQHPTDQRGFPRDDGACDSGSFESGTGFLSLSGECPGTITIAATSAVPGAVVEIFQGPEQGASQVPAGACAGAALGITDPASVALITTDQNGEGSIPFNALAADCGQWLQGMDEAGCIASNVERIDSCDLLTTSHTGSGADPTTSPPSSPDCPDREYVAGEPVTLTAAPDPSWSVGGWSGTDDDSSTGLSNLFTMSDEAHEAAVHYVRTCSPLTVGKTGQGSIPVAAPANSPGCALGEYVPGELIELSGAVPDPRGVIGGWTGTDDDASTDSTNSVTMPAAPHTATVDYVRVCFRLFTEHTGEGADPVASPPNSPGCPASTYLTGEIVDLTAAPDTGWEVLGWSGTDDDSSTAAMNSVTMPQGDHTAAVDYVASCYSLTLDHTGAGADPVAVPLADGTAWSEHVVDTAAGSSLFAADIDGDLDLDLLVASDSSDRVYWWENTAGDGSAWAEHEVATDFDGAASVIAVDIDGDTDLDIVAASTDSFPAVDGRIIWWENTAGDGSSWSERPVGVFDGAHRLFAADIDGDTDLDLLASSENTFAVSWWENVAGDGGAWTERPIAAFVNDVEGVVAADLDGDTDLDVVAAGAGTDQILWWENTAGDGSAWTPKVLAENFSRARWVHAEDVDGDTDIDVVGAAWGADGGVAWFENTAGDGSSWTRHTLEGDFGTAAFVEAVDMDGDGDRDILGSSFGAQEIAWWDNLAGDGTAWKRHPVTQDFLNPVVAVGAQINGDADLDVVGLSTTGGLAWWETVYGVSCPAGSFRFGDTLALAATPDPGWEVSGWSGTDDDASTMTTNSATMPAGDHTISVHYVESAPTVSIAGTCPGQVTVTITTPEPNQPVLIFAGNSAGTTVLASGPCAGTEIGISSARRWRAVTTDADGGATISQTAGGAWCGRRVQALDQACSTSNLATFPSPP